jgi:hypothetical protein
MVRIAISQAAFEAIVATLPLGSVGFENKTNEQGEKLIWLDRAIVDSPARGQAERSSVELRTGLTGMAGVGGDLHGNGR